MKSQSLSKKYIVELIKGSLKVHEYALNLTDDEHFLEAVSQ